MPSLNLMLVPSMKCPASCEYCFSLRGSQPEMTSETMRMALRWFRQYMDEQRADHLTLTVHGGEPLSAGYDFYDALFREIDRSLPRDKMTITIQSNLWLLTDELARLLRENRVSIGSSLDGPPAICDAQRGQGYYERTMEGVEIAERNGLRVGFICTLTPTSASSHSQIVDHFASMNANVSLHPCVRGIQGSANHHMVISPETYGKTLNDILDEYLDTLVSGGFLQIPTLDSYLQSVLDGRAKICTFMNCLGGFMAVGPTGNIYPCQRFVGTDFVIGHVSQMPNESQLRDSPVWQRFEEREKLVAQECGDCPHFPYCHGGCPYNALAAGNGDFTSLRDPYCTAYRSILDRMSTELRDEFFSSTNLGAITEDPFPVLNRGRLRKGRLSMIADLRFHPMRFYENSRRVLAILALGHIPGSILRVKARGAPEESMSLQDRDSAISDTAHRLTAAGVYRNEVLAENELQELVQTIDQGQRPYKCYIHINLECNLECTHCYVSPSERSSEFIPAEDIINLTRQAARAGYEKIVLTGGEPLLHPERESLLKRLCWLRDYWRELVREQNYTGTVPRVSLRTNMMTSLPVDELKLLGRAVDVVVVSIDGDRETHDHRRGLGTYYRALKNLKTLLATEPECEVRLGSILNPSDARGSLGEAVRRIGANLGIGAKIRNFYPIGESKSLKQSSCAEPLWANYSSDEVILTGEFFAAASCGLGSTLDIRPDGSISPCFALQPLPYELGKIDSGLDCLRELLEQSPEIRAIRQATVDSNEACSRCMMRYLCHGPCRAWSDELTRENINPVPRTQDCQSLRENNLLLIRRALEIVDVSVEQWIAAGLTL